MSHWEKTKRFLQWYNLSHFCVSSTSIVCVTNDITGLGPPIPLQKGVMKQQTKHFYCQKESGGVFFAAGGMEENRPFSLPAFTPVQLQNLEEITWSTPVYYHIKVWRVRITRLEELAFSICTTRPKISNALKSECTTLKICHWTDSLDGQKLKSQSCAKRTIRIKRHYEYDQPMV